MSVIRCNWCDNPLTKTEVAAGTCPACHHHLADVPPERERWQQLFAPQIVQQYSAIQRRITAASWVSFVAAVCLLALFGWTFTGPYGWLVEMQVQSSGKYYPKATYLATCLILFAPAYGLIRLLANAGFFGDPVLARAALQEQAALNSKQLSRSMQLALSGPILILIGGWLPGWARPHEKESLLLVAGGMIAIGLLAVALTVVVWLAKAFRRNSLD
jgi:hypothetical protein